MSPAVVWRLAAADGIGETDCEAIGTGLLAQPANTISSLAYVAVAAWIVASHRGGLRWPAQLYAANVAMIGIGSVVFHGPMWSWARIIHDVPIATTVLFILLYDVALVTGSGRPIDLRWWIGGSVAVLIGFIVFPDASVVTTAMLVAAAIVAEIARLRTSGERWRRPTMMRRIYVLLLLVIAGAAVFNALGRTAAPLCEPASWFQGHAVWHLLSAAAFGLWSIPAFVRGGDGLPATGEPDPDAAEPPTP